MTPKLTLNLKIPNETDRQTVEIRVAKAVERKAKATEQESVAAGFIRVGNTKLSDKERGLYDLAFKAFQDGTVGKLPSGKLTKEKVLAMGRKIREEHDNELRQQRIRETLGSKPDNYFILTNDAELPKFMVRLREEVLLQRKEWTDRFELLGVESMTAGDFEGTGIDSYIDLSIGFSIWLPLLNEGYYLPYGHVDGFDVPYAFEDGDKQLTRSKVISTISPYLSNSNHGKTFHMGAARYDLHIALNDGYRISGCVWDTLDAMNLMNEHEEAYGLKPLVQKYGHLFGVEGTVFTFEDLFGNRSPAPFNTEIVGIYAINDVKYGWSLFNWQFEVMKKTDHLMHCYSMVDKDLPETDVFMERCGFRIDLDLLSRLEAEFEPKIEEATKRVFETYGIDDEFVRVMDRKINANKITKWINAQQKRIEKSQEKIEKKQTKVSDLEKAGKTHTKSYTNEVALLDKYRSELRDLAEPVVDNAPQEITEFSITNGNHIGYLIYDHLGIEDKTFKIDRNKKRSTAADVLDMYYEDEPALEPLATVAEYTKLLTTYIRPILGSGEDLSVLEIDGRLHSNFKAGGTKTGRYSSSSYNARPTEVVAWA
ncbi:DNA polymerase [Bacillus wiedmannii]|nr:DNA polymerase [Bacillus wiedmannii]